MRNVAVLGATGSVGKHTLDAVSDDPDRLRASVLVAHSNVEALVALCIRHRPDLAIIADTQLETDLARRLAAAGVRCDVASGHEAICYAAGSSLCDVVVCAMTGLASLDAALTAARAGKRLVLANNEPAVIAGSLLRNAAAESGGEVIPLSTAAHAIAQYVSNTHADLNHADVRRLILTSFGGPFAGRTRADLMTVTPDDLGATPGKLSDRQRAVDSATLMNTGLEALAIHHLFLATPQIQVRLTTRSIAPAILERADGSIQALGRWLDARSAIDSALHGAELPNRHPIGERETLSALAAPDPGAFRCLTLALAALREGGDAPALLNAANEVAVAAFLAGSLPFLSIADLIEQVLTELPPQPVVDIQTLRERDRAARAAARRVLRTAC
ncbi:1-deoxy-D-xylulose-5-phosphate reductoisomerase [Dyella dinghuensis]|uniref:1-deoxy-D-xylulose 5-phosphate reductoisomerase n=1 Tax=Dyella dinghuensis TaxID=1920169 RepID=A0A432LUP7_9GAMM|nr:1-deoxy-D-xylulose-5-phosphate reductoisomerase [Dyella dinghuensis]